MNAWDATIERECMVQEVRDSVRSLIDGRARALHALINGVRGLIALRGVRPEFRHEDPDMSEEDVAVAEALTATRVLQGA